MVIGFSRRTTAGFLRIQRLRLDSGKTLPRLSTVYADFLRNFP